MEDFISEEELLQMEEPYGRVDEEEVLDPEMEVWLSLDFELDDVEQTPSPALEHRHVVSESRIGTKKNL